MEFTSLEFADPGTRNSDLIKEFGIWIRNWDLHFGFGNWGFQFVLFELGASGVGISGWKLEYELWLETPTCGLDWFETLHFGLLCLLLLRVLHDFTQGL